MMALVIVALVQAQQPTVDDRIAAFLNGDAEARAGLVKAGSAALHALRKAREQSPEKVDPLILDIKKAAAYPKLGRDPKILAVKCDLDMDNQKPADVIAFLVEFCGAAIMCDFDDADLKSREVDLKLKGATVPQALDLLCRETGLDFGFFHNVLVVSKPERLWGTAKNRPAFGPPAVERQHRKPEDEKTIEKLRKTMVNIDFQNGDIRSMADYIGEISGIRFEVDPADRKPIPTFRVKELSVIDVLSLATQMRELDFIVQEEKVIVAPPSEIEKRIAGKK